MPGSSCAVRGCVKTSAMYPDLSFFKLPSTIQRRKQWLTLIGRQDLSYKPTTNYTVCEIHFSRSDLTIGKCRLMLKKSAIPVFYLPKTKEKKKEDIVTCDNMTQTEFTSDPKDKSPEEKRRRLDADHETFGELCDTLLTGDLAQLAKARAFLKYYDDHERDTEYMQFCVNLYCSSPETYNLYKSVLNFPSPDSLKNYIHTHISLTTDLNETVISILKAKVGIMTEAEKYCSILLDVVNLEPELYYDVKEDKISGFQEMNGEQSTGPANQALVAVARGIFRDWRQPIAYTLLSGIPDYDGITNWIDDLIEKLIGIGFKVKTLVSGSSSLLYKDSQNRFITIYKPYFHLKYKKIYQIFDAPELLMSVRNNFQHYNFHFNENVAKFEHVVQFYNQEKEKHVKVAHLLTDAHINPSNSEKQKIQLAAELLSKSVAAGISTYSEFSKIDKTALDTALFIDMMARGYEAMNSSNSGDETKSQIAVLTELFSYFKQVKFIHPINGQSVTTCATKFIGSLQITINSMIQLLHDLKSEGFKFTQTKRLNKEPIDSCFRQIKTNPHEQTCERLICAYRKLFYLNITKPPKVSRKIGLSNILMQSGFNELTYATPATQNEFNTGSDFEVHSKDISSSCSEYNQLQNPEMNSFVFISGYILRKCAERHKCETFNAYVKPTTEQRTNNFATDSNYAKYKNYSTGTSTCLRVVPSDDFINYVQRLETIFRSTFETRTTNYKMAAKVYEHEQMKTLDMSRPPCPCFPLEYLKLLFIRIRLLATVKHSNSVLRTATGQLLSVPELV